jgi:hypothetical protein
MKCLLAIGVAGVVATALLPQGVSSAQARQMTRHAPFQPSAGLGLRPDSAGRGCCCRPCRKSAMPLRAAVVARSRSPGDRKTACPARTREALLASPQAARAS